MTQEGREARHLHSSKTWEELSGRPSRLQHAQLERDFRNRYNAHLNLAVVLARLSPAFAFNNATVQLAGSGLERQRRFLDTFHLHYRKYNDWFRKTTDRDNLRRANPAKHGKYKWDIADMPRLLYREEWPGADLQTALVDIGIMAVWGLIFFLGAYVGMVRYDVR